MGWTTDTPATQEQFDACEFYGYSMDIVGEDSVVYEVLYSAEDDSWEVEASDTYSCEWPTGGLMEGVPEATIGVAVLCEPEYIESLSSNEVYIYGTTAKEVKQYAKELKEAGFSKDFSIDTYDDGSVYASGSNGSKDVSIKFHPEYNRAELWVSEY